jgi:hypothetical protein
MVYKWTVKYCSGPLIPWQPIHGPALRLYLAFTTTSTSERTPFSLPGIRSRPGGRSHLQCSSAACMLSLSLSLCRALKSMSLVPSLTSLVHSVPSAEVHFHLTLDIVPR